MKNNKYRATTINNNSLKSYSKEFDSKDDAVYYIRRSMRRHLGKDFAKKIDKITSYGTIYESISADYRWRLQVIINGIHLKDLELKFN